MVLRHEVGIWERFIPEAQIGQSYKYELQDSRGYRRIKADPYAIKSVLFPHVESVVTSLPKNIFSHSRPWHQHHYQHQFLFMKFI